MTTFFIFLGFAVFSFYMAARASKKKNSSSSSFIKKKSNSTPRMGFTISTTSPTCSDDIDEYEKTPPPIPFDDREILSIHGERYYVVWYGTSPEATFSVNRKEKITISPTHVLMKDEKIHVAEIKGDDIKVIPTLEISSQIQVRGHNRRSFWEWIRIINPNFPWNFHRSYPEYETCERDYSLIWEGELAPTTFSRYEYNGYERSRKRETVTPLAFLKGKLTGETKLKFRDSQNKELTIKTDLIDTMLDTEGHKKKRLDDWVNDVLLASNAQ
ncbi:hypothetical protein VAEKB19_6710002 [Vibrio aestuarianus]|nr:hypothetical protein VAEKB19_6710002 [Vibrio aestuarianus]